MLSFIPHTSALFQMSTALLCHRLWCANGSGDSALALLCSSRRQVHSVSFPHGCKLGFWYRLSSTSQYFNFIRDKMKFTRKKQQQKYSTKTLNFNQLHRCRLHTGSSRGLSWSLRALSAVCKLTFTREDSLGTMHTNHSTEGYAAVKGTGAYNHFLWKNSLLGKWYWGDFTSYWMEGVGWSALCWQHPVKMHEEQSDTFLLNVSATV